MFKTTLELSNLETERAAAVAAVSQEPALETKTPTKLNYTEPTFGWFVTVDSRTGQYIPSSVVNSPDGSRVTSPATSPRVQMPRVNSTPMFTSTLNRSETRNALLNAVANRLEEEPMQRAPTPVLVKG